MDEASQQASATEDFSSEDLTLEVRRGPLSEEDYRRIHSEHSRLVGFPLRYDNFLRWICRSPAGPALHSMLRRPCGQIVGHAAIFPFHFIVNGQRVLAGKGECLHVHEGFRRHLVCAGGKTIAALALVRELYAFNRRQLGWDPIFVSAVPGADRLSVVAGCRKIQFALHECLLILRPLRAVRCTPNVSSSQRAALLGVGCAQAAASTLRRCLHRGVNLAEVEMDRPAGVSPPPDKITFSRDTDYLRWRYPAEQFVRYSLPGNDDYYVICRRGSPDGFLRVCTTNIDSPRYPLAQMLSGLVEQARRQKAVGVRWAVYEDSQAPGQLLKALKSLGFLCRSRTRSMLLNTARAEFLDPARWHMEDSIVAFEH